MVGALVNFKDYSKTMGGDSIVPEASVLHNCMRVYTQKKMEKVFSLSATKLLFRYYCDSIVTQNGECPRLQSHKAMCKNYHKYMKIMSQILELC